MRIVVADVETAVQFLDKGKIDGSPYNPKNQLVSVGCVPIVDGVIQDPVYEFMYHKGRPCDPARARRLIQSELDAADLFVAHNAKFDIQWLLESGFTLPEKVYCTQVGEYIFARGRKDLGLSLEESCIRNKLPQKKSDLVAEYWRDKVGFESMPWEIVQEYGIADILSAAHLYLSQQTRLLEPENESLKATFDMSMEFMYELALTERNGIAIDISALDEVESAYRKEQETLHTRLSEICREVMGDTPTQLSSPEQLSTLIYSRTVRDKKVWAKTFNLGKNDRGKDLPRPKMSSSQFTTAVRQHTDIVRRTIATHCDKCHGKGYVHKVKKDGSLFARPNTCGDCNGSGYAYKSTTKVAGLKLLPTGVDDVRVAGFATDADSLELLVHQAKTNNNELAVEFLQGMMRLNALETYINNFCMGIRGAIREDGVLHPNFNQTVTSTGRLSSSQP